MFKILKVLFSLMVLVIAGFAIFNLAQHRVVHYFINPDPQKDEIEFLRMFEFYLDNGWYKTSVHGGSMLFNFVGGLIQPFTPSELFALKWTSLLSLLILVFLSCWYLLVRLRLARQGLLFSVICIAWLLQMGFTKFFAFTAGNDTLFSLFIFVSFLLIFDAIYFKPSYVVWRFVFGGVFIAFALSVREIIVLYVPAIIILLSAAYYYRKISFKEVGGFCLGFVIVSLVLNYPSLIEVGRLSFHDKNPGSDVTWAESNYLWIIKGGGQRPTFDDVRRYKIINGKDSLPHSYLAAFFFDLETTARNTLRLVYYSVLPFIRQCGLVYLILILGVLLKFRRVSIINAVTVIFLFAYIVFTLSLSLVMVWNLEFRWFLVFFFLLNILGIFEFANNFKSYPSLKYLLYLSFIVISSYNAVLNGIW